MKLLNIMNIHLYMRHIYTFLREMQEKTFMHISSERDFIPFYCARWKNHVDQRDRDWALYMEKSRTVVHLHKSRPSPVNHDEKLCFARSSTRFRRWLRDTFSHRVVLLHYRQAEAIYNPTRRRKKRGLTLSAFWNECQNLLKNFRWSHKYAR